MARALPLDPVIAVCSLFTGQLATLRPHRQQDRRMARLSREFRVESATKHREIHRNRARLAAACVALGTFLAGTARAEAATPAAATPPTKIDLLADQQAPAAFALYRDFLTLPNVASRPDDILRVIEWLEREFGKRGFATERLATPGSDLVLATRRSAGASRTVLVYLQADGQPVDPSRWFQDSPWMPTLKARREGATSIDGNPQDWQALPWERLYEGPIDPQWRMFARSAADSKGPVVQFLSAVSLLDAAGVTPGFDLKVIIDTEEELGSPNLAAAVAAHRDRLAADFMVILDGPPHTNGAPTLAFGARGIADVTLTAYGPRVPQHSGQWGNYVPNPALRLAQVLASMKDAEGRVTIPGFYDGVVIDEKTRRVLEAVPKDVAALHRSLGIARADGVAASPQEAIQYPSLNIRGLRSAWVGEEARTIIPADAVAELDVRLVQESDPDRLLALIRRHIEAQGYHVVSGRDPTDDERAAHPRLMRFESNVSYRAFRTEIDSEPGRWLVGALERMTGEPPVIIRTMGGSVPISPFVEALGVPAVQVGTVNPDNNQHSPNENLRVFDFLRGIRTMAAILSEPLGEAP
jgi:acetylornithine deacetylase/succinyl-diaminopimelate desuccinylase-like protein